MSGKRGFALVAVLGGLLLVGALAFTLLYVATLDGMAARYAQSSVIERGQLEAALQLAAHELDVGAAAPDASLGPWPALGIPVTVEVTPLPSSSGPPALRLEARATSGARAPAVMVVAAPPGLEVLWRP